MNRLAHLLSFLALALYPFTAFSYPFNLSICMIFQDDASYLKEWIEFHRLLGVDHFYLFNNLSQDHYREVLAPYVQEGVVELFDWPFPSSSVVEWDKIQVAAYDAAWRLSYGKTKWLALLDSDEFLFPTQKDNLSDFLADYEGYGGICVNWVMYGTAQVSKIPNGKLMIETLVQSAGRGNEHFKSIFRPERVLWVCSPHYVLYQEGYGHVTPNHTPVLPPFVQIEKIRINHYWSRDEEYLQTIKIPRRIKWGTPKEVCELWSTLNNSCYDPAIFRFIEPLRQRMGKVRGK